MRVDKGAASARVEPFKSLVCTKCNFNNHQELLVERFRPQKCAVCENLLLDDSRSASAIENGYGSAEAREGQTTTPSRVKNLGVSPIHDTDSVILVCPRCSSVPMVHETTHCQACSAPLESQSSGRKTCASCTLVNKPGAIVCDACETLLEDRYDAREALDSGIATSAARSTRWTRTHPRASDGASGARTATSTGLRASSVVSTVAELTARTVEDGGDAHSVSTDLVPWLHKRLLEQYGRHIQGGTSEDVREGASERTPARRRFVEGPASGGKASSNTLFSNGGATAMRPCNVEWILCHPSTAHCTQRGAPGSKFSCGYRNIQMLCSALLKFPEYRSVLFGGSDCVPGIHVLQGWIERAWADGYDPEGCEQLGGPGALLGSETWIGATECATLLRSFGIRAQVVDFEVQGSPGDCPRPSSRVGEMEEEDVRHNQQAKKRKALAPTDTTASTAREGRASLGKQTSILDFLSRRRGEESMRRRGSSDDVGVSSADMPDTTADHQSSRDLSGRGVSSHVQGAQGTGEAESTAEAAQVGAAFHSHRARGAIPWSGTEDEVTGCGLEPKREHGGPGARSKCSPAREDSKDARGDRLGKGKPRDRRSRGKAIGQDKPGVGCGRAVTEWALEYFRTPWREEHSSHAAGSPYGVLRAREDKDARRERSSGFEASSVHGSNRILPRGPPPLYLQHDGHSRTVVGVLWSEKRNVKKGSAPMGSRQQPGTLLIFDPSHKGNEIRDALMDYGSLRWCSLLKRGECSLRRRQFQVVAVRPGLIKPEHAHEWKKIVSVKIRIGFD